MGLKRKTVTLASLTIALLCVALGIQAVRVMAQTRTVGVQVGSWAHYSFLVEGNVTGVPNEPVNATLTVTGISGTNVTCQTVENFKNGTQKAGTGSVDVNSGSGNTSGNIIAANLNAGELVYNGPWSADGITATGATINGTATRSYLGESMEVCYLNLTQEYTPAAGYSIFESVDYVWLRGSGMAAEEVINMTSTSPSGFQWWYMDITITSSTVPEFPVSLILPLFVVLSTLVVVIAKKRLVKK